MANPFAIKSWSACVVAVGTGALSWFVPELLGISPWVVIGTMVGVLPLALWLIERRGSERRRQPRGTPQRRASFRTPISG